MAPGQGSPPVPYTQNTVESINNLCKVQADFKKYDWATVNNNLKAIALEQRTERLKAVFSSGAYTLSEDNHMFRCVKEIILRHKTIPMLHHALVLHGLYLIRQSHV